jgi:hypothetical protein
LKGLVRCCSPPLAPYGLASAFLARPPNTRSPPPPPRTFARRLRACSPEGPGNRQHLNRHLGPSGFPAICTAPPRRPYGRPAVGYLTPFGSFHSVGGTLRGHATSGRGWRRRACRGPRRGGPRIAGARPKGTGRRLSRAPPPRWWRCARRRGRRCRGRSWFRRTFGASSVEGGWGWRRILEWERVGRRRGRGTGVGVARLTLGSGCNGSRGGTHDD